LVKVSAIIRFIFMSIGTDEKHEDTEAVFSLFFVICPVFRDFYECRILPELP
jgi:hypothetical protein